MSIHIDDYREKRQGFPEVVFGQGKSLEQLESICAHYQNKETPMLVTRVREDQLSLLESYFKKGESKFFNDASAFYWFPESKPLKKENANICLVCAGSSDFPMISEADVTLQFLGLECKRVYDVGVAGIHRLLNQQETLHNAEICIVAAGMDGALPSVVGGLVSCPVIAIPTSVGYGSAFGGVSALLSMLNSCANGINVVNIDNGFGAAMSAWRIYQTFNKKVSNN